MENEKTQNFRAAGAASPGWTGSGRTTAGTSAAGSDYDAVQSGIKPVDYHNEERYWSETFPTKGYAKDRDFDSYRPAYRYGADLYSEYEGRDFDTLNDSDLSIGWERAKNTVSMTWEDVKEAVRDAYNRLFHSHRETV